MFRDDLEYIKQTLLGYKINDQDLNIFESFTKNFIETRGNLLKYKEKYYKSMLMNQDLNNRDKINKNHRDQKINNILYDIQSYKIAFNKEKENIAFYQNEMLH